MESVKFRDVSESQKHKAGWTYQTQGVRLENFIQNILEGGELINYRVRSEIFLKKPLGGNHLHFVKKWHPGLP